MGATHQTTKTQWWVYELVRDEQPPVRTISSNSPPSASDLNQPGWIGWRIVSGPFSSEEEAYRTSGVERIFPTRPLPRPPESLFEARAEFKKAICPQCGAYDNVLKETGAKEHTCPDDDGHGKTFASFADLSTGKPETLKEVGISKDEIISGEAKMEDDPEKGDPFAKDIAPLAQSTPPEEEEEDRGAFVIPVQLSETDPVVNKILATLYDANDTVLALGQRVVALEAEVNALRGDLTTIAQRPAQPTQQAAPPTGVRDFRPSHYSQIDANGGEDLRRALLRWLEGR